MNFVDTPGLSTPNMDRIAKEGVYFNQAFVNYPVCSPSKASIYTGTYCHANGLRGVTTNFHGPATKLPTAIANHPLTKRLRIGQRLGPASRVAHSPDRFRTLVSGLLTNKVGCAVIDIAIK